MAKRPISVQEAAAIRGVTEPGIIMAIRRGTLAAVKLSDKGWLLSEAQVRGKKFDLDAFLDECANWICVPEACEIVCKTDAMVIRDLKSGVIRGFRLNQKAWAVDRRSAEREIADYMATMHERTGRPRDLSGRAFSPRVLKPARAKARKKKVV